MLFPYGLVMSARLGPTLFTAKDDRMPIETARAVAVLLLVSYHVIGSAPSSGLHQAYPAPLRLFADFFVDLRMPLFAMIAGMVFAMKPVAPAQLPGFFLGKIRRLVIPGIVAILAFELAAALGHTQFDLHQAYLRPFFTGYAHFWFLQAILLIFIVYAPLDSISRGRLTPLAYLAAVAISLSHVGVPQDLFSADGAMMLMPYFLLGVMVQRHQAALWQHRWLILAGAAALFLLGSAWNLYILRETGEFSMDRRDAQSLISATGGCLLAMFALPRIRMLDRIGALSFTIYLYHVFGTSLTRRLLDFEGMNNIPLQLFVGIALGLILPIAIHKLAERYNLTRLLILGLKPLRPQKKPTGKAASAAT